MTRGVEPRAEPRTAARVILRDRAGLVLLFNGRDPAVPDVTYWFTPGGGLDTGETFAEAAARELREEAGFEVRELGDAVREDEVDFSFEGVTYRQRQRYFAVEVPVEASQAQIDPGKWTDFERRSIAGYRWWPLQDLESTPDSIYPPDLAGLVRTIAHWGSASPRKLTRRGGTP